MRRIVVINAKGGCGKTTVATNLAAQYAAKGYGTALFDQDPQSSSMRWLERRPASRAYIHGVAAYQHGQTNVTRAWAMRVPAGTERIIMDCPAGLMGYELTKRLQGVECILVPLLPSTIDIHSTADFIRELASVGKIRERGIRLAIVANRIRVNTKSLHSLERFHSALNIPAVARLRDTQNYVRAVDEGCGIHELKLPQVQPDVAHWAGLFDWLEAEVGVRPSAYA